MSLFRNGSGYYDPTAGKAIKKTEKDMENRNEYSEGDIVDVIRNNGTQMEMVLLKCHKKYATALALMKTEPDENAIEITSKTKAYTDAGKVQYVFYDNICGFLKATTTEEFEQIKEAVKNALDLQTESIRTDENALAAAEKKIADLRDELRKTEDAVLLKEREYRDLQAENEAYRKAFDKSQKSMIGLEAKLELMKELYREK